MRSRPLRVPKWVEPQAADTATLRARLLRAPLQAESGTMQPALRSLGALHSSHIADCVDWLTFGVATRGGLLSLTMR